MELPPAVPLEKTEPESSVPVLSEAQLTGGIEPKPWMKEGRPDATPGRTPHPLGSTPPTPLWLLLQALVRTRASRVWLVMDLSLSHPF